MSNDEPQLAGLLPRLGAAFYDLLLLAAVFVAATAVLAPFMPADHVPAGAIWFQLYLVAVAFLFHAWFWTHGGQTLGMRAWRLRVLREDGRALEWKTAAMRFFCAWPAWLSVAGILACARGRPALHDRLSRTRMIRLPKA